MARYEIVNWVAVAGQWEDKFAPEYDSREFTRVELQRQIIDLQTENGSMPDRALTSSILAMLAFRGTLEPIYKKGAKRPSSFIVHWLDKLNTDDMRTLSDADLENIGDIVVKKVEDLFT